MGFIIPLLTALVMVAAPPIIPVSEFFTVPTGPLPWNLPILPSYKLSKAAVDVTVEFAELEHTDGFEDSAIEIEAALDSTETEFDRITEVLDKFVGAEGPLPGMSEEDTGDWSTTTGPLGEPMSAYDYAETIGSTIGTTWSWARAVLSVDVGSSSTIYTIVIVNIAWFALLNIAIFAIQVFDFFTSLMDKLASVVNILTGPFT